MTTQSSSVNVDLLRERESAALNIEEFAEWWAGGRYALSKRRDLDKLFFDDTEFEDVEHIAYKSHKELFEYTTAKATRFLQKLREFYFQNELADRERANNKVKTALESLHDFRFLLSGALGTALFQQSFPLRLHFSMFMPALLGQSTEEQQHKWFEKAWHLNGIIGTYAQTELGHGSFLRGLETRADYEAESEEFVLNTPTMTAYKWWPGGLGHTANVVIVMAQLYIKGKHYGLHPFLVRIRNAETHVPEPGVDVGEIGVKIGLNGVNNGFLGLQNVRIPRTQMLMKNAKVLPNGKFIKGAEPLLTYGTMVFVRVIIVRDVSFGLLQAATIATRYSAVRRQGTIETIEEVQVLDHLTQQAKVFPQIAKGVFYRLAADYVWVMYQGVMAELEAGNRRNLAELHALSCCLKAICSHESAKGIEILRKSCGGHGFLTSANFSQIYGLATAACTYEGENTILLLQTARFLIKNYVDGLKRKVLPKSVTYLRNQESFKWSSSNLVATLTRALQITAVGKIRIAFESQQHSRNKQGYSEQAAINIAGPKLTQAAMLHGRAVLARIAGEELEKLFRNSKNTPTLEKVLKELLEIFILDMALSSLGDILRFVNISAKQIADLEQHYERTLLDFRRNAVAVVDGFDFHDRVLDSTLGCYDGRVYERLMEAARKSPLNQELVSQTFHTHLQPLMKGKL